MKTVTAQQMREIDRRAIEEFGIPGVILMENAGREVARSVESLIKNNKSQGKIGIICGSGNNGGDGLVAARYLHNKGFSVEIILIKPTEQFRGDSLINCNIAEAMKLRFSDYSKNYLKENSFFGFSILVDALLGTGTKGEVAGIYKDIIGKINKSGLPIVSVDIPSGIDADSGEVLGIAVKAEITVTMGLAKRGLLSQKSKKFVGKLAVADIGLPSELTK
ncbi:MAG: NAD(P)H-hydrate epimerase [Endomicrobiales bacterium]|nr:NAD(P)H-hydrate epimerase [Endomicrobiales bacterium]